MIDNLSFEPERIFQALNDQGVDYVVIGGLAAVLHGSPLRTGDADVCPSRTPANLAALARALAELDARLRIGVDEPIPLPFDPHLTEKMEMLNLVCQAGEFDLTFHPAGTSGYDDLAINAVRYELDDGLVVMVASLDDVIRSKEAADRPKDHETLPTLRRLRAELQRRSGD